MKLDNRGWGYRDMIIYSCILLFCLLLSVYFVNSLYNDLEKSAIIQEQNTTNSNIVEVPKEEEPEKEEVKFDYSYYFDLEDGLKNATYTYINEGNVDYSSGLVTVNSSILIDKGYLKNFYDQHGNRCSGYSNVIADDMLGYTVESYILCNDYSTAGY